MSIDDNIDTLQNQILGFFLSFIPPSAIPYLLRLYSVVSTLSILIWEQTKLTTRAIFNSFFTNELYFFKLGRMYIPYTISQFEDSSLSNHVAWRFHKRTKEFFACNTRSDVQRFHCPWIGATLYCHEPHPLHESYDLSEWLDGLVIYNTQENVPFQVLVSAWANSMNVKLHYPLERYTITLMELDGTEKCYNVYTEEEMEENNMGNTVEDEQQEGDELETIDSPTINESLSSESSSSESLSTNSVTTGEETSG